MFKVPESCPRIALRAETRMMSMKHRIWQYKLLLLKRIKRQSHETLSWKIWKEQRSNNWPGLSKEVSDICNELNILDINDQDIPEGVLKRAVFDHHLEEIKEKVSNSKKMMKHKEDNFQEVQDYMLDKNVEKSRMSFRIRCEMVPEVKGNFKDKHRRKGGEDALICNDCSNNEIQTQSHCIVCPKWDCIRSGLEMNKLDDLVIFFQRLLMEKTKGRSGSA